MKARYRLTTVLCLSASLVLLTASPNPASRSRAPQDASPGPETGAMAEDVEILRRVLVQALVPKPAARDATQMGALWALNRADLFVSNLTLDLASPRRTSVTHSRAFHVPGSGVFLCLDVEVPVKQVRVEAPKAEPNGAADDLWAQIEQEVRGQESEDETTFKVTQGLSNALMDSARRAQHLRWTLDPAYVQQAESAVVEVLARHGARLEHLDGDQTITVALHLSASARSKSLDLSSGETVDWLLYSRLNQKAPEQRLVVQLACRDIARHARGDLGLEGLQQCATVHRY